MYRLRMFGPAMLIAILLIAGAAAADNLDLLRLLQDRPWLMSLRWDHHPGSNPEALTPHHQPYDQHRLYDPQRIKWTPKLEQRENRGNDLGMDNDEDEYFRIPSQKRSAVATALNAGRRRRQPAPALGKIITRYAGVGVLNDMGMFFDSLRDNLEVLASLSPEQRATLLHNVPTVVQAPGSGSSGGSGMRRLHALRPLRPTGNIRSYNRRSFVEADGVYPGANNHDPGLLWTGLGRR